MANTTFSQFFPASGASSGGSGGNGLLKQQVITTSGTVDLVSLGIADGALIQLFLVGGGQGGGYRTGGRGGKILSEAVTVGTAGTATITIGAGGAVNLVAGGATTITGGGISTKSSNSGYILGGVGGAQFSSDEGNQGPTIAGFSQGGTSYSSNLTPIANNGQGGGGGYSSGAFGNSGLGGSGIAIIYYS